MFKGNPRRSADDVNREFDEMGAHYNAFTNGENTVFLRRGAAGTPGPGRDLLADILRPALRDDDFHTEKSDPEENPDVRGPAAVGADDKCRALYYVRTLGAQCLGHRHEHRRPVGRRHARLFPAAIQPGNMCWPAPAKSTSTAPGDHRRAMLRKWTREAPVAR